MSTEWNIASVKAFLSSGDVKIDEQDEDGMTALLQASYRGNVKVAQLLVNSGADVNWSKHKQGYTALMFGALSGKIEIIEYLLSQGAKTEPTNCVKRTAAEMAAFVGNHFASALINTYIEKEELLQFTKLEASSNFYLFPSLVDPLHCMLNNLNFSPVKVYIYLSSSLGKPILDNSANVVAALERLCEQHFTPQRTHEHISMKLHLLSCIVKRASEFLKAKKSDVERTEKSPSFPLEPLIKLFLRGVNPHGLAGGQESFLRKCIISFPHSESNLWRQTVTRVSQVEVGEAPTALAILENAINGLSPFARSAKADESLSAVAYEPCATCADMPGYGDGIRSKWCSRCHEVAYCSVTCQKLHWFTHKRYCSILKEHHDSVAKVDTKTKPSAEEMSKIQGEISSLLSS
nr:Zinc finger MYND type [Hymenolepis microstoma]